jgi:hypothetical protein
MAGSKACLDKLCGFHVSNQWRRLLHQGAFPERAVSDIQKGLFCNQINA